jgi:hypothetical protein
VIWKTTSYHMQTAGDYAITKTATGYFAWHLKTQLNADPFPTADQAKGACERTAREKANG